MRAAPGSTPEILVLRHRRANAAFLAVAPSLTCCVAGLAAWSALAPGQTLIALAFGLVLGFVAFPLFWSACMRLSANWGIYLSDDTVELRRIQGLELTFRLRDVHGVSVKKQWVPVIGEIEHVEVVLGDGRTVVLPDVEQPARLLEAIRASRAGGSL